MMIILCITIFALNFRANLAVIAIDFDEYILECGNGLPLPSVDISKFNIINQEDGTMVINGTVKVVNNYGNPTRWRLYSEKLEQGKWNPGFISRDIPNFCTVIKLSTEAYYQFTKYLKQDNCPIQAGHLEQFDNLNIGNIAGKFEIPAAFIGDWKFYTEITTFRNGRMEKECYLVPAVIAEV